MYTHTFTPEEHKINFANILNNKNKRNKSKRKKKAYNYNFNWRHLLTLFNEREIKSDTNGKKRKISLVEMK